MAETYYYAYILRRIRRIKYDPAPIVSEHVDLLYKGRSRKAAIAAAMAAEEKINARYGVDDGSYEFVVPETGDELTVFAGWSDENPVSGNEALHEAYYEAAYGPYEDEGVPMM